jgi:predicted nucleic acid-binding protein
VAAYFVDSSALVKRYVQERGTAWVRSLTHRRTGNQILLASITVVEVTAAVARRRAGKTITPAQASPFLSQFRKHVTGRYTHPGDNARRSGRCRNAGQPARSARL